VQRDVAAAHEKGVQPWNPVGLPVNTGDNRPRHTSEIRKFPVLGAVAEQALFQRSRDHHDIAGTHHSTGSYLRLVVKIAMSYRGYGLASEELNR
jgi:RNA polymerase sigma-32 factor